MEKTHKFVGIIIDKSYFEPYQGQFSDLHEGKIRTRSALMKICEMCGEPRPLSINSIMTRGNYHNCERLFLFGGIKWEWGQFVFLSKEKL